MRYTAPVRREMKGTLPPAIVLGCHKIGLGIIRALGEAGVPVLGVYYNRMDMGYVSKYVIASYHSPHPEDEDAFVSFLRDLAGNWRGGVLIPSDDATLVPTSRHKGRLEEDFKVSAVRWDITEKCIDKKRTYALADSIGVPAPKTRVPRGADEAIDFVDEIGFPCLLKPSVGHRFYETFKKKMVFIENVQQLKEAFELSEHCGAEMMIQEYIPGDDTAGANYNSFFVGGVPRVEVTAQKVRLAPPRIGFPRVVVSKYIPEVLDAGRKILSALDYDGFSCTEFKRDARDGVYKLMEVNGRLNLSTPLSVRSGVNFPYLAYRYSLEGTLTETPNRFTEGIYWIDIGKDIAESFRNYGREDISLRGYLEPYLRPHVFTIMSARDPMPFLKRCIDAPMALVRAIAGKTISTRVLRVAK